MSLVGQTPEIVLLDGVATLPCDPSFVLVADAAQGVIWRINTATRESSKIIDDPSFKPADAVPLGVNGIHILRDQLYFTNLATNSVGKLRSTPDGHAAGPVLMLTDQALAVDDFALADDGTLYAAGFNTLWEVQADGGTSALVGGLDSPVLQGNTSARFGRTEVDKTVVYMATQGGMSNKPSGSVVHGGQLLAVNLEVLSS